MLSSCCAIDPLIQPFLEPNDSMTVENVVFDVLGCLGFKCKAVGVRCKDPPRSCDPAC